MTHLLNAYRDIMDSSSVEGASPRLLVQLLLDACSGHLESASGAIVSSRASDKVRHLCKAGDIVRYLRNCLSYESQTKEMSQQLANLYLFVEQKILEAGRKNDPVFLQQAKTVLENIRQGWSGLCD